MNTLQRILAATDLSAPSLHALDRAFAVARASGAAVHLLHALELELLVPLGALIGTAAEGLPQRLATAAQSELQRLADERAASAVQLAGIEVADDSASDAIPRIAAAIDADLVVLGAHGRGFLRRMVLGSTASRVLRKSLHPLLVVKRPCQGPYRRVLVAVDLSPVSAAVLRTARQIAPGADIVLSHVYDLPYEGMLRIAGIDDESIHRYLEEARKQALQALNMLATEAGLGPGDHTLRVAHGDAARQLLAQEHDTVCDLVAIGKHGRHAMEELLIGSVATHMLGESRGDVLLVPGARREGASASRR